MHPQSPDQGYRWPHDDARKGQDRGNGRRALQQDRRVSQGIKEGSKHNTVDLKKRFEPEAKSYILLKY